MASHPPTGAQADPLEGQLTAALPSSTAHDDVHAAPVRWVPFAGTGFAYPEATALCGVPLWGPAGTGEPGCCLSKVTCGECRATTSWKRYASAARQDSDCVGTTVLHDDDQDHGLYCWICGEEGHSPSDRCQREAGMI